jgi:chitinase
VTKSVTVTPYNYNSGNNSGTPSISFYANPANVYSGGSSTLYWAVSNANVCTASGSWSGSKGTSGNEVVYSITNTRSYTLSCTSSTGQTTTQSVTIGAL